MLMNILIITGFLIGLIGAGLVSYGAWLWTPAAGFVTAGVICLFWSWMTSRLAVNNGVQPAPKGDD